MFALLGGLGASVGVAQKSMPVTYYSRVSADYERPLGADGYPQREFYALGYGGRLDGTVWDHTQSKEDYPRIAGIVAEHLAEQNYQFAFDAADATLLITIHWGRTGEGFDGNFNSRVNELGDALSSIQAAQAAIPPPASSATLEEAAINRAETIAQNQQAAAAAAELEGSILLMSMENRVRTRRNEQNARVLGYTDEMARMQNIGGPIGMDRFNELRGEVEEARYYIVLTAYDFRLAKDEQKKKVLWTSRMSIRTRGHRFAENIATMVARAADSFGQNSGRLVRNKRGEVEIGEITVMDDDVETPSASKP
ncbi:hypothetical protein PXH66_05265 [Synoicihabitans lomoniglobus]|uniref:Uncharacterized protein n=1 Tax=Synoicihabitans lomoniglobus TaxID=2909285 RepID=A0AAF0I429_9BACT|nr:hypothetical protein PXH66_05265 [Opitutaceae bacterium LMO-M01]